MHPRIHQSREILTLSRRGEFCLLLLGNALSLTTPQLKRQFLGAYFRSDDVEATEYVKADC